jgi:hypothetical protein
VCGVFNVVENVALASEQPGVKPFRVDQNAISQSYVSTRTKMEIPYSFVNM